ncbi:hypothetical protein [Paenisporosarcina antarctica]|uniref:IDEAL domain-containing protein n=1 Tax=Paenisporosarcina antarctica TaxID=417367 RepID=A0A4V1AMN3_9BACL|nr:hypothetical protein [Paenisporosarcina antarctica]QBP39875.1 hypothetical protein E2636_01315 [Paenisporosarcina antarctica]
MNFQIGDNVIICSEYTSYFQEKGIIQSIDIYGYVKVLLNERAGTSVKVKREELRLIIKSHNSPYLDSAKVIDYIQNKNKNESKTFFNEFFLEQVDLSLDTWDKEWFIQLTKRLK